MSGLSLKNGAILTGALIGVSLTIYNGILLFGYTTDISLNEKVVGFVAPAAVSLLSSILSTMLFFDIFSNEKINKWLSLPLGAVSGLIEGAIIGGLTYSSFFAVMHLMDPDFSRSKSLLDALLMGLYGGGAFGALIGILPGIGVAALIRFNL